MDKGSQGAPLLSSGQRDVPASRRTPRPADQAEDDLGDTIPAAPMAAVTARDGTEARPVSTGPSSGTAGTGSTGSSVGADDNGQYGGFTPGVWADPEPPPRSWHRKVIRPRWAGVFAAPVRPWLRGRVPRDRGTRLSAGTWRLIVLVLVVCAAAGIAVSLPRDSANLSSQPGLESSPAAVRDQAASWIVQQVSRAAIVSCDPAMCAVLQAHRFPAGNLLVIRPGTADPLGSDVIAATSVLRSQFGSRLTSVYAPDVVAAFGAGSAGIQIRPIAPNGAGAYLTQLRADLAARKSVGGQLLHNLSVAVASSARQQLAGGLVDARLLATITTMAAFHPLQLVTFGAPSPGAAAGMPLRSVTLLGRAASPAANAAILRSVRVFLNAQQPPYLPANMQVVRLATGQSALRIQFAAPAPLGLLGAGHHVIRIPSS